jgi:hypothetical protein
MVTTAIAPRTLTLAGVRAEIYASQAEADADPATNHDELDALEEAMNREAHFILDRYGRSEGWDTTDGQIGDLHEELVSAGIGAARGAMIELAAFRLIGTRSLAPRPLLARADGAPAAGGLARVEGVVAPGDWRRGDAPRLGGRAAGQGAMRLPDDCGRPVSL